MRAPRTESFRALPMFFGEAHRAFGEATSAQIFADAGETFPIHDPSRVAQRLAELSLFRALVPRAHGGLALDADHARASQIDVRALCMVREALAYASPLADAVFAVHGLGTYPMAGTLAGAPRADRLARAMTGEQIGAFALTEPLAGSDIASMRSTARRADSGDGWVLDGEKIFISNVGIAHQFIVFANADPSKGKLGISAFVVDANAGGLTLESMATSTDHPLGRMVMSDCRVSAEALIGAIGDGMRVALGTLDVFRTTVGAAAVGMAQRALDETLAWVSTRHQFGQPIGDFQLTQAALADMATDLDAARLLVCRAAWLRDRGEKATAEVAMAKMFATEAAQRIVDRAVQLHGGAGTVVGSVVERLYREVRPLRIYEGTTEIQKLILGRSLLAKLPERAPRRP